MALYWQTEIAYENNLGPCAKHCLTYRNPYAGIFVGRRRPPALATPENEGYLHDEARAA